jgi:hypothetical protein
VPHKYGINDCRKECYGSGGNIKFNCGECHSCKGRAEADKIAEEHEYGKFCKRSNNCSKCAFIKFSIRMLFHLSDQCFKNCPACKDPNLDGSKIPRSAHLTAYSKEHIIYSLYRFMFRLMSKEV